MVVEQASLGQEVSAVPKPAQLATVLVGLAQLGAQQWRGVQAHTEAATHQQAVQALHLQIGQLGIDRQRDTQVAHHLGAVAHHLDLEQRRGTHQVCGD
ncbi:hypothetical protein D3C80_2008110 [compost metagenome]